MAPPDQRLLSGMFCFRLVVAAVALCLMTTMAGCGEGMRSGWKSAFAEANGIRLHYWRTGEGSGKPVIVAAHGITDNGLCWTSLAAGLSHRYDLILYDARGHGLSGKPETGYGMASHAADLAGLIAALELERPIIMGHSMGGSIAAVAAAEDPALATALVLIDPAWLEKPGDPAKALEEFQAWFDSVRNRSEEKLMKTVSEENPHWPFEDWQPWAESKTQVSARVVETYAGVPDLGEFFPRITIPVLVVKADAGNTGRKRNEAVAALLARGKIVHIDGAGHSVHRDKPVETLETIRRFLRRRPLWKASAMYDEAYRMKVSAEAVNHLTHQEMTARFTAEWTPDPERAGKSRFAFSVEDGGAAPEQWEKPPPAQWLAFHRAGDGLAAVHRTSAATLDRDGVRSEYELVTGQSEDGERVRYWIDRDSGLVRQLVLDGPTRWTLFIHETEMSPGR